MRPRMLLEALMLFTITASCALAQSTQPTQPAQVTAVILLRDGEATLIGIAPYKPHMDDVANSPFDKDGYAWQLRDVANRSVREGRGAKTVTSVSEWDAAGKPDPRFFETPTLGVQVVVPNVGGTLVIYDAPAGARTGPQLAALRLPVVPAGAVVCVTLSGTLE